MSVSDDSRPLLRKEFDEERIEEAEKSLKTMLGVTDLVGKRFLDIGCGSGLFSLAARRLGARVRSFDHDLQSLAHTQEVKRRYFTGDPDWIIDEGSVLDKSYLAGLGQFDVVYGWGVLHHTGAMWQALVDIVPLVAERGRLYISIYNDQGFINHYWRIIKREYARTAFSRWLILLLHVPYIYGLRWLVRTLAGRKKIEHGMSLWQYTLDLFRGYPFEVARPEDIVQFYWAKGFLLENVRLCGSHHGCNEFVFVRDGKNMAAADAVV
jgi:2-polyprenyl-6-hydroxyphenyl methylase/3-demethylubiquinone-9 3-methyltransferase